MRAQPGSLLQGTVFLVIVEVPNSYPFSPPIVTLRTRVFHPNVSMTGEIALPVNGWSPGHGLRTILRAVLDLLESPSPDWILNPEAGDLFRQNPAAYRIRAADFTRAPR